MLGFGGTFFNWIGAIFRWIYGNMWRTIFKKKKFKFNEYLYGIKSNDIYDGMEQQFAIK